MRPVSDFRLRQWILASFALVVALAMAAPASAVPVIVTSVDVANCDPLFVPNNLHELGLGPASGGPFPGGEEITAGDIPVGMDACSASVNTLVSITNLTGIDWIQVWYVADPETTISNFDGFVNGEEAFLIDSVGVNAPLVFESMTADGIFEAGETWDFVIDDYFNVLGLPASAFGSCLAVVGPCFAGLVGAASGGDFVSSGSIIAIPEPTIAILIACGLAGLAARRRRST